MSSNLKVFNDGSGVAIFREDSSTVLLLTESLEKEYPSLYELLKENTVSNKSVMNEVKAQGLLDVDYCYR